MKMKCEIFNFVLFFIRKICTSTRLPCVPEIVRSLDQHNSRPKRFERDDQMSKMKFGFKIQLNSHVFHTVLRLPPLSRSSAINNVNLYNIYIYITYMEIQL